ncbi:hypothetical protein [Thalassotalea mangrovi]|uniref:Lipoprotein n=1 Tax=Thalassotalea mangrovi TaxID=2572245 RepID=A0A4U1B4V7_9GAMM|nr:hypothetical protein [Thalassotalea mangrovi]TKB45296.1 hypothetical protein E8M12_08820 [Thalassotalea mangrovi]
MKYIKIPGVLFVAAAASLSGCAKLDGKVTVGGTLNSKGGAGQAVLTAHASRCDDEVKGQANYQDKTAIDWQEVGGVAFNAEVYDAGFCSDQPVSPDGIEDTTQHCRQDVCTGGMYQVDFIYKSTNPAKPGEGAGFVCMIDTGNGVSSGFGATGILKTMAIESGPYQGYTNAGTMSGNVKVSACPSDKSENS